MLYIVTGATGHLGNTLIKKLSMEGKAIRALVLPNEKTPMLDAYSVEIVRGNVVDKDSLRQLFDLSGTPYAYKDICLIHCAGIVSISNFQNKLMHNVNVNGTANLLWFAKELGIGHFIYISSVHALKEPKENTLIEETLHFHEDEVVGSYAKSKAEATRLVTDALMEGYPITIIHPSGIIGPFDFGRAHMTRLITDYFNNKLNARVEGMYDFVDVRDVADAIYVASVKKAYGPYLITGHQISLKDFFINMQEIAGRKTKAVVFTHAFVKIFLPMIERYAYKKGKTPLFTKYALYTLTTHSKFSNAKARRDLDYDPRPIYDTIKDSALWLIGENRINHKKTIQFIIARFKIN